MDNGEGKVSIENAGDGTSGQGNTELPAGLEPVKRGRGRPKKDGSASPVDTKPRKSSSPVGGENASALESAQFIAKGFVGLVELVESFVHSNCARKIEKKYPGRLGEFKEMAARVALQPKDADLMEKSAEKIALKYDVLSKYGPEVVLSVVMLQYGARQMHLIKFVDNVTKETEEKKTAEPGAPIA